MTYGYSRISTNKQSHDRQIEALTRYGVEEGNIYKEVCSGTKKNKPVLAELFGKLRENDKIVIEEFSRIGRSTRHVLDLIEELNEKGVELISLSEKIESKTPVGRLMIVFLAAICEFEAAMIRERVQEGVNLAKANGKRLGRKPTEKKKLDAAIKLYLTREASGFSVRDVARVANISIATLYRELDKRGLRNVNVMEEDNISE